MVLLNYSDTEIERRIKKKLILSYKDSPQLVTAKETLLTAHRNISGMEEEKSFFVENIAHYFEFEKWSERARLPLIFKTEPRKSSFGSDL